MVLAFGLPALIPWMLTTSLSEMSAPRGIASANNRNLYCGGLSKQTTESYRLRVQMAGGNGGDDRVITQILSTAEVIAVVGATNRESMPVYGVMQYLQQQGYKCIPVNERAAERGESILGEKAIGKVSDIADKVDLVDIFMRSDRVAPIFDDAIKAGATAIWTQLGISDDIAAERARAAGLLVVQSRCPVVEIPRLGIQTPRYRGAQPTAMTEGKSSAEGGNKARL